MRVRGKANGPVLNGEGSRKSAGLALITGASSGIGRELARAFASRGYDLILLSRDRKTLTAAARDLVAAYGVGASVLPADLCQPDAPLAIFEALDAAGIEIDVLVNNAGVLSEGDFAEIDLDEQLRLIQINIVALTAMTRLFLPGMKRRRSGRILNVASIGAFMPLPRLAVYGASKAFVLSLTEALAEEVRRSGVTVSALCPGLTDTSMLRGSKLGAPISDVLAMSAAEVAERGCEGCLNGETIVVPGLANQALISGAQFLPRALVRAVGGLINVSRWGRVGRALLTRGRNGGASARKGSS